MTAHKMTDVERTASVESLIFLSKEIIEPAYRMLVFYLRHLCYAYGALDERARNVPGLKEIFGSAHAQLPGKVLRKDSDSWDGQQLMLRPGTPSAPPAAARGTKSGGPGGKA